MTMSFSPHYMTMSFSRPDLYCLHSSIRGM